MTAPLDLSTLEAHLWESANILRGPVDAADFKTYIFPLLFFKRISDVCDEETVYVRPIANAENGSAKYSYLTARRSDCRVAEFGGLHESMDTLFRMLGDLR